ncbi:hypothetical protein M104_3448 [Bacteroides fragilis str. 1007-1-F |uniref:Uncharacterized protein n=1 Tax=Bacteroides fragilis str. 1007-1-F \|nr:hypothetical protein M101_3301 [Bacteroides fragilis str. 1007-1-F \
METTEAKITDFLYLTKLNDFLYENKEYYQEKHHKLIFFA